MSPFQPISFCLRFPRDDYPYLLPEKADSLTNIETFHSEFRQRLLWYSQRKANSREQEQEINEFPSIPQSEVERLLLSETQEPRQAFEGNHLQLNVWPLIYAGISLAIVGDRHTGKTTSLIISLINRLWIGGYLKSTDQPVSITPSSYRMFGSHFYCIILTNSPDNANWIFRDLGRWFRIICPGQCRENEARNLIVNNRVRVVRLAEEDEELDVHKRYKDVAIGCAVLIATVDSFLKLLESRLVPVNSNHLLVIDNMSLICPKKIERLIEASKDPKFDFLNRAQTITLARHWNPVVNDFFRYLQFMPVLVINSLAEVGKLFKGTISNTIYFSSHATTAKQYSLFDPNKLGQLLLEKINIPGRLTAIVCIHQLQLTQVKHFLTEESQLSGRFHCIALHSLKSSPSDLYNLGAELDRLMAHKRSLRSIRNVKSLDEMRAIVVLVDDELISKLASYCSYFDTIIHLNSIIATSTRPYQAFKPSAWYSKLNTRLLLGFDQFKGLCLYKTSQRSFPYPLRNFFLVYATYNHLGFYRRITYLFTTFLLEFQEDQKKEIDDSHKNNQDDELKNYIRTQIDSQICVEYQRLGRCYRLDNGWRCCKGHHNIRNCIERPPKKSSNFLANFGQIKFRITQIESLNEYFITIKEYRNIGPDEKENIWHKAPQMVQCKNLNQAIKAWTPCHHKFAVTNLRDLIIGKIYGIWSTIEKKVIRVKLLEIEFLFDEEPKENRPFWQHLVHMTSGEEARLFQLSVNLENIDTGRFMRDIASHLVILPEEIANIPPLACRAHLVDIKPPHGKYFWYGFGWCDYWFSNSDMFQFNKPLLQKLESSLLTAWVLASSNLNFDSGNTQSLWITQMVVHNSFHTPNGTFNIGNELIKGGFAERNEHSFPQIDYEGYREMRAKWRKSRQLRLAAYAAFG